MALIPTNVVLQALEEGFLDYYSSFECPSKNLNHVCIVNARRLIWETLRLLQDVHCPQILLRSSEIFAL